MHIYVYIPISVFLYMYIYIYIYLYIYIYIHVCVMHLCTPIVPHLLARFGLVFVLFVIIGVRVAMICTSCAINYGHTCAHPTHELKHMHVGKCRATSPEGSITMFTTIQTMIFQSPPPHVMHCFGHAAIQNQLCDFNGMYPRNKLKLYQLV